MLTHCIWCNKNNSNNSGMPSSHTVSRTTKTSQEGPAHKLSGTTKTTPEFPAHTLPLGPTKTTTQECSHTASGATKTTATTQECPAHTWHLVQQKQLRNAQLTHCIWCNKNNSNNSGMLTHCFWCNKNNSNNSGMLTHCFWCNKNNSNNSGMPSSHTASGTTQQKTVPPPPTPHPKQQQHTFEWSGVMAFVHGWQKVSAAIKGGKLQPFECWIRPWLSCVSIQVNTMRYHTVVRVKLGWKEA